MKYIGWCLERIQITIGKMPPTIVSEDDKRDANWMLDEIQKYADTLAELIINPKFQKQLHQLENVSIESARMQAHDIRELLKDLEHMLYVIDLYIKELREIIVNRPEQWGSKADQLALAIDQKFGAEMGELRKEFKIAIHTEEDLRAIVASEQVLQEFLK